MKLCAHFKSIMVIIMMKTYTEMLRLPTYEERYRYLRLNGFLGEDVFGSSRWVNQAFYQSRRWRSTREKVIIRDNGCDLCCEERPIFGIIHIHHINPVTLEQIEEDSSILYDLENLVCTSDITHRAIHYGDESSLIEDYKPRRPGDTTLW